jgi:signal transduction histidine kinase
MSVSLRLTLWFSAAFMLGYLIFGIAMYVQLSYSLEAGRDKTLMHRANRAITLLETCHVLDTKRCALKYEDFAAATPEGTLISVFDAAGTRLYPVVPDPSNTFPWPASAPEQPLEYSRVWFSGSSYRMLSKSVTIDSVPLRIVVGGQLKDNKVLVTQFRTGLLWATPIFLAISALFGYFLSRRALNPVGRLIASVRSISIGNLSRRLPAIRSGDELEALTETCNDMLARLDTAVGQITRFTADASHELRSPISYIYTLSECALRAPGLDTESAESFSEIVRECEEATRLLDDMLSLARFDSGHTELVFARTDLVHILDDVCSKAVPFAERNNHQLTIDLEQREAVWIMGDAASLRRLFWVMLDNAFKYTPSGGTIAIRLQVTESEARIHVQDSGIGIPQEALPQIFSRF